MRTALLTLGLVWLGTLGCGDSDDQAGDGPGGPSGAPAGGTGGVADGGMGGAGGSGAAESDPDEEQGPPWDGSLPANPTLLAEGIAKMALLANDDVVFSSMADEDIRVVPAQGGASANVGSLSTDGLKPEIVAGGQAAFIATDDAVTGWSAKAGLKAISGIAPPPFYKLAAHANAAGDRALLVVEDDSEQMLSMYWVDTETLTATHVGDGPIHFGVRCLANGAALTCIRTLDLSSFEVFSVGDDGATTLATIDDGPGIALLRETEDAYITTGQYAVYSIGKQDPTPIALVEGEWPWARTFQGGWVVAQIGQTITAIRSDGSDAWTIAEQAQIAHSDNLGDASRHRMVPYCDHDETTGDSNLRVVDLETREVTELSDSCKLRGLTYSDKHALVMDNWKSTPNDPLVGGFGDPVVVNIETGHRMPVATGSSFTPSAVPLGQSKWVIVWLSFGSYLNGGYYDGHSEPNTPMAMFQSPIGQFAGIYPTQDDARFVFLVRNLSDVGRDLYVVDRP